MPEYIERGELIIGLQKDYEAIYGRKPDFYNGYQIACRFVENFQTADVAPVRHGRWILERGNCRCATCLRGYKIVFGAALPVSFHYCPNCGAKMDGGDDK